MKHVVVTVGCEFGSGGTEIGKLVAKGLGVEYYDRDLVDKVVEQIGVDKKLVEKADNKNFVPFVIDTDLGAWYANLSNKVIATQVEVIRKLAKTSCVIIGRCSDYVLKDLENVVNVFVYAPFDVRVQHIMRHMDVSEKEAESLVHRYDRMLQRRYEYITGTYCGDRKNRHLMIDSSALGIEGTATLIQAFVEMKFAK